MTLVGGCGSIKDISWNSKKTTKKTKVGAQFPIAQTFFTMTVTFIWPIASLIIYVAAVFLVTGLIENDIIIRNAIREHSLSCLSRIVSLIGKPSVSVTDLQSVAAHLLHLSSLLDIAFWSGHVSQMNLSILQQQIRATYETLNDLSLKYKNSFYIGSSFFKTNDEILSDIKEKDIDSAEVGNKRQNNQTVRMSIKDRIRDKI
jgi:hypothetical protein